MKLKNKLLSVWHKQLKPYLRDPLLLSKWVSEYSRQSETGRMTVWVNGGYKTVVGRDYGGELFMFLQDMHQGIMPFRSSGSVSYTARLEPSNSGHEQVITEALSDRDYRHHISEGLDEFIRHTTQSLFYYSETFSELYCERDSEDKNYQNRVLSHLPTEHEKFLGQYFQIIP